jgi:hypothetical protein
MRKNIPVAVGTFAFVLTLGPVTLAIDTSAKRDPGASEKQPKERKPTTPTMPAVIRTPSNKGVVSNSILVSGTSDGSAAGDIWVLVWPELAPGRGWPQSPDAASGSPAVLKRETGEWSTVASFGGRPQSYDIAVYTASRAASRQLSNLLRLWARRGDYPGMTLNQIPTGLIEQHRITVRKE